MEGLKLNIGQYVNYNGVQGPAEITINQIPEFDINGLAADDYKYTAMQEGQYYSTDAKGLRVESGNSLRFTNGQGQTSVKYIQTDSIPYDRLHETTIIVDYISLLELANSTKPYNDISRLLFSTNGINYYLTNVNITNFTELLTGIPLIRINEVIITATYDTNIISSFPIIYSSQYGGLLGLNYTLTITPAKMNKLIGKQIEYNYSRGWSIQGQAAIETNGGYTETSESFITPLFMLHDSCGVSQKFYTQIGSTKQMYTVLTNSTPIVAVYNFYWTFTLPTLSTGDGTYPEDRPLTVLETNNPGMSEGYRSTWPGGQFRRPVTASINRTKYPEITLIKTLAYEYEPKSYKTNDTPNTDEGSGGNGSFDGYDKIISDSTDGLNGHLWSDYNGMFKSSVSNYLFGHYPINDVNDTNAARHLIGASQRFTWGNFTKLFNKKDLDLDDLFVRGYFLPFKAAYITPDTTWTESVPTYGLFNEPIASKTFTEATGESVVKALTSSFDTTAANNVLTTLGKESNAIAFVTTEPYYYRRSLFRFQKIDYGTKEIKILFDDYNDFINTSYKLTLPFGGGEHELNPNELFRDKDGNKVTTCLLEIYGIIDLDSGMMLLNVISNENMILQTSVNPAVDIILTGRNDARIVSGVATTAAATAATVAAIATKGLSKINQTQESNTAKEEAEFRKDLAERRIINQEKNTDIRQDEAVETRRRNDIWMEQNKILREGRVNK